MWRALNGKHQASAMCSRVAERFMKKRWEEEARMITVMAFEAYMRPLERVAEFKYLWRILTASGDNFPVVVSNLQKSRKRQARL